jgi:hypothetical protein
MTKLAHGVLWSWLHHKIENVKKNLKKKKKLCMQVSKL